MKNATLTCFGVGDGSPCADRNHSSFLYRFGKTSLLVDCGEPVDGKYKATGLSYETIDGICLSHLHSDHVGGFFMLMQGMWLEGRKRDLPMYLPGGSIRPLRAMLDAALLFEDLVGFRLQLKPWKAGKPTAIGNARITPFPTTHLDGLRAKFGGKHRNDFSAYCFLIESGGVRVGHSADLGRPDDLEPLLEKPLDLLVCELSHFAPEDLFACLRGRQIKYAVFTHLARSLWENLGKTRRLAARLLPDVPHSFVSDGEVIRF